MPEQVARVEDAKGPAPHGGGTGAPARPDAVLRSRIAVRHYLPGGREHGGGIGRLVGYIQDEAARHGERHVIADTRGARMTPVGSPLRFLGAVLTLVADRVLRPDCLQHVHVAGRGSTVRKLVLTAAARAVGSPYLLHLHDPDYGDDLSRRRPVMQRAVGRMFRGAARVIVLGGHDRDLVRDRFGVAPERIEVLHNAVPDPHPAMAFGRPADAPLRILFLGRLSERKGVPELLRALASPTLRPVAWQAVLAGDGPVDSFRRDARALGIDDRVETPGWVSESEVRALCARSDVLVLPSRAEAMAMAVLEGLANGLAVVTTRVGAHGEVIRDGETGLFVPVGDAEALAVTLAALARDPARRERLARAGRAHFLDHLSIASYAVRLRRLYAGLRAERAARRRGVAPPRASATRSNIT